MSAPDNAMQLSHLILGVLNVNDFIDRSDGRSNRKVLHRIIQRVVINPPFGLLGDKLVDLPGSRRMCVADSLVALGVHEP